MFFLGRKMYQVKAVNEIEVNLSQEKIYLMTPIIKNHTTGKKTSLESVLTENERNQLTGLVPPRVFLARKAAKVHLKSNFLLNHNLIMEPICDYVI